MHQQEMLKGLTQLNGSVEELFAQIKADATWRPRENMRTLMELANHLAQIPAVDLAVLRGASEIEVKALEQQLLTDDPAELANIWHQGVKAVSDYFGSLSLEMFAAQESRAFYGHKATLAEWLLEIITHAHHHRAQLFTYLKLMGRPVDMFTLYA